MPESDRSSRRPSYSKGGFLRRGAFVAVVRFTGLLCVFGLQVLLARLIGDTAEYGKYAWGQSLLFLLGTFAALGLPLVIARFVAALTAQKNEAAIAPVVRAALKLLVISSSVLMGVALLLVLFWQDPGGASAYRDAAIIALLFAPAVTFTLFFRDLARARHWLGLALLPLQVIRPCLTAILALAIWLALDRYLQGVQVLVLVGLSLILILAVQGLLLRSRHKRMNAGSDHPETSSDYHPSRLIATALPIFVTRCAGITITYANVIIVGSLAGPAAAGAYFAAERLAKLAGIPKDIVTMVNQQSMAAAHAVRDHRGLQSLATQSAHGSLWPTLLMGAVLAYFAAPLLQVFGEDFAQVSGVLLMLIVSVTINVMVGPAQDILIMTGRQALIPRVMVSSAVIHVIALFLLVPAHGAMGAAWASVLTGLVSQFWLLYLTRRETGIATTVLASVRRHT